MPISITFPPPGGHVGPGIGLQLRSDFIGPLPTGSFFRVQVYETPEPIGGSIIVGGSNKTSSVAGSVTLAPKVNTDGYQADRFVAPVDGATVHVTAELFENPSTVIDSGTTDAQWESGIGQQLLPFDIEGTTGGLTPEQATQLTETHAATFTDQLLDTLTLIPLTSGPSAGPINTVLQDTVFGVIVRLASIPEELVPTTPDGDYWGKTLAVVRVFRSSDLWFRYPIHTSNRMISFATHDLVAAVTALTATQWLLNMTMQVTFLEGVTGEVFLMRFP